MSSVPPPAFHGSARCKAHRRTGASMANSRGGLCLADALQGVHEAGSMTAQQMRNAAVLAGERQLPEALRWAAPRPAVAC